MIVRPRHALAPLALAAALAATATAQSMRSGAAPPPIAETPVGAAPRYLLREGTLLRRVVGTVTRNTEDESLRVRIDDDALTAGGYELTLLPCLLLDELEQVHRALRQDAPAFEVSGRVFVYQDRNYLMLTQPALAVRREAPPEPKAEGDDSADAIARSLESSVGIVPRRTPGRGEVIDDQLLAEGTKVVLRAGRVRRGAGGSYVLVFDADATGFSDAPMTILPCMLLERLAPIAMAPDRAGAVLVSGTIYAYGGRNYLLPTVFRRPAAGR